MNLETIVNLMTKLDLSTPSGMKRLSIRLKEITSQAQVRGRVGEDACSLIASLGPVLMKAIKSDNTEGECDCND